MRRRFAATAASSAAKQFNRAYGFVQQAGSGAKRFDAHAIGRSAQNDGV